MKYKRVLIVVVLALCVVMAGTAAAQANKPNAPEAATGTAFTYQGQIKRNGALFTGTCDMQFSLWDDAAAGSQQGVTLNVNAVNVDNGVFAVELDFGNQFKGEARWLEAAAKCADDADSTTLPRVALNSTPYAIGLMPGAQMEGSINGTAGILRASNNGEGAALVGLANSTTGATYGVLGNAFSPNGYAVWGYGANNATAVRGFAAGGGRGVWGSSETWHGVYGESRDNVGVLGKSTNFDGVWGETDADNANGVIGFGKDPCPPGSPAICSAIHARNATGVAGEAFANGYGVWGRSATGVSVAGFAPGYDRPDLDSYGFGTPAAMFGGANGVIGFTKFNGGNGVSGVATTAGSTGVYGYNFAGGYAAQFFGKAAATVLEIRGGSDLAERFATVANTKVEPGTVMVIDEDHPGKLKVSDAAYDGKVIGIISGAGGINTGLTLHQDGALEGDLVVAIAGRVYCKAEASSAPIKPGDLLTTSNVPGYCMKANDRDQAYGAVIGKALTGLDKGEGLVLAIVNLQ